MADYLIRRGRADPADGVFDYKRGGGDSAVNGVGRLAALQPAGYPSPDRCRSAPAPRTGQRPGRRCFCRGGGGHAGRDPQPHGGFGTDGLKRRRGLCPFSLLCFFPRAFLPAARSVFLCGSGIGCRSGQRHRVFAARRSISDAPGAGGSRGERAVVRAQSGHCPVF